MSYEAAMEFVSQSPDTDGDCINLLNVLIRGMETFHTECAEANFEPDCVACQASVIMRKFRADRDDWLVEGNFKTREEVEKVRADHEAKLIAENKAFIAEWEADHGARCAPMIVFNEEQRQADAEIERVRANLQQFSPLYNPER